MGRATGKWKFRGEVRDFATGARLISLCVCVNGFLGFSIEDWLRELVSYVGMCSPELSGCKVLAILLSKCSTHKVQGDISTHISVFLEYAVCMY